jgi:hypothetical protein
MMQQPPRLTTTVTTLKQRDTSGGKQSNHKQLRERPNSAAYFSHDGQIVMQPEEGVGSRQSHDNYQKTLRSIERLSPRQLAT